MASPTLGTVANLVEYNSKKIKNLTSRVTEGFAETNQLIASAEQRTTDILTLEGRFRGQLREMLTEVHTNQQAMQDQAKLAEDRRAEAQDKTNQTLAETRQTLADTQQALADTQRTLVDALTRFEELLERPKSRSQPSSSSCAISSVGEQLVEKPTERADRITPPNRTRCSKCGVLTKKKIAMSLDL